MSVEVWIVQGKNKVRLTTPRGVDIAEEVNNSLRATLQKQEEEIVGKIILANPDGSLLPLIESLVVLKQAVDKVARKRSFFTGYYPISGIGTAAAYASGDAFGTKFAIPVPKNGQLETAVMLDLDDEGIETELWLFHADFTATADNAAFAVSDADLVHLEAVVSINTFVNASNNQVGINNGLSLSYEAPSGFLYCQCVIRGAPNIAANNIPLVGLRGVSYE